MSLIDEHPHSKYFSGLPVTVSRIGRPTGARNRASKTAKENIQAVFDGLGGWEAMLDWAVQHRSLFYGEVYPRLLAKEGATKGEGITVIIQGRTKDVASTHDAQAEVQAAECLDSTTT